MARFRVGETRPPGHAYEVIPATSIDPAPEANQDQPVQPSVPEQLTGLAPEAEAVPEVIDSPAEQRMPGAVPEAEPMQSSARRQPAEQSPQAASQQASQGPSVEGSVAKVQYQNASTGFAILQVGRICDALLGSRQSTQHAALPKALCHAMAIQGAK